MFKPAKLSLDLIIGVTSVFRVLTLFGVLSFVALTGVLFGLYEAF